MDTETYKVRRNTFLIYNKTNKTFFYFQVAIELLNRFTDKTNGLKTQSNTGGKQSQKPLTTHSNHHNNPKPIPVIAPQSQSPVPSVIHSRNLTLQKQHQTSPQITSLQKPTLSNTSTLASPVSTNPNRTYLSPYNTTASNYQLQNRTQVRTPFPIINQNEKGILDKILDILIGDGQASQYGMICKECFGHNGIKLYTLYHFTVILV